MNFFSSKNYNRKWKNINDNIDFVERNIYIYIYTIKIKKKMFQNLNMHLNIYDEY